MGLRMNSKIKIVKNLELSRVNSKGQILIPKEIIKKLDIKDGDYFATFTEYDNMIVLRKIEYPITEEESLILKELEEAWKEIDNGEFISMSKEKFLAELKEW